MDACNEGDFSKVRKLLDEGRVSVHDTTEEGESLLSLACSAGYYELAQVSYNKLPKTISSYFPHTGSNIRILSQNHILKISISPKITIRKSHILKIQFQNLIFHKILNSQFQNLIFLKIHIFKILFFPF